MNKSLFKSSNATLSILTLKKLLVLTQDVLSLVSLYDLNICGSSWDVGDEHIA